MRPNHTRAINRALVRTAAIVSISALGAAGGVTIARADGILNATESSYVGSYGVPIVCASITATPTPATVIAVVEAVMGDGFTPDNAVDIVNASVALYCDEHWPLLQRVGELARGERGMVA